MNFKLVHMYVRMCMLTFLHVYIRTYISKDLDYCVIVYTLEQNREGELNWVYLGKYRAHYKPITGKECWS